MKEQTAAWLASAEQDALAARLLAANAFYSQSVFFTHLSVEKTIKALIAEEASAGEVSHTHNLARLLRQTVHTGPPWLLPFLVRLSVESTDSRYTLPPETTRYTSEVARRLLEESEEARRWLKQQLT